MQYIHPLEQAPPTLPPLLFRLPPTGPLLACLELTEGLHLLQHRLEEIFAAHNVQVAPNLGVFAGEAVDLCLGESAA